MSRPGPRALAAAAGLLNGLCWLPLGFGLVAPLFAFLWFRALRAARGDRDALAVGLIFGVTRYVVAGHFILSLTRYSPLAIALFALYVAYIVPFALLESWGALALERRTGVGRTLWAGALFTLLEWLRSQGDLSFPADMLAHDLASHPAWLGWSRVFGPSAATALIFLAGGCLDLAWERAGRLRLAWAAAAATVWLSPWMIARATPPSSGASFRVALVQTSIDPRDKLNTARWPETWETLERLTREGSSGADLVVWPETARPGAVVWNEPAPFGDPKVERISREVGVPILYGCQIARRHASRVWLYNGAVLVYPDGRPSRWYGKERLLPFAEGVPFGSAFGWDPSLRAKAEGDRSYLRLLGNFAEGPEPAPFEVGPARIGVRICYEASYPQLARDDRRRGANLLAVLSDDGWWGRTLFPRWHASMVAARGAETGLPIVRAVNGRTSPAGVQRVTVTLAGNETTPYVRYADLPLAGVAAAWLAVLLGRRALAGQKRQLNEPVMRRASSR